MIIKEINVEIPDDSQELEILKQQIENMYADVTFYYNKKNITRKKSKELEEKIRDVLYAVADLSIPYFRINENLRNYFLIKNKKNPEKARDEYLKRYYDLHKPYDSLKNKCYLLFRKLEKIKKNEE